MEHPGRKSLPINGESSSVSRRDYEVFLSFRGPDTCLTITDSLYAAMIRAGIRVFKDDEKLRVGEEIGDYASSKWCLRELTYMMECKKREKKVVLPIFYKVDASDVKLKTGLSGKALQKHGREFGEDTLKQWEEALKEVTGIKG